MIIIFLVIFGQVYDEFFGVDIFSRYVIKIYKFIIMRCIFLFFKYVLSMYNIFGVVSYVELYKGLIFNFVFKVFFLVGEIEILIEGGGNSCENIMKEVMVQSWERFFRGGDMNL